MLPIGVMCSDEQTFCDYFIIKDIIDMENFSAAQIVIIMSYLNVDNLVLLFFARENAIFILIICLTENKRN